jgi:hypothetical protein
MLMFAGAAMTALDVLSSLTGAKAQPAPQASSATAAFDLAEPTSDADKKSGVAASGNVPALSSDTMNALLLSLFDTDKDGAISAQEFKSAMGQNAKLVQPAMPPGQSLSLNA